MCGRKRWGIRILFVISSFFISGCLTFPGDFAKFYKSNSQETFAPIEERDEIEVLDFSEDLLNDLKGRGYLVLGESTFSGPMHMPFQAKTQAQRVGANVILLSYKRLGSGRVNMQLNQLGGAYNQAAPMAVVARSSHYAVFLRKPGTP